MEKLWDTPIELAAPYRGAAKADVTGVTAASGWHFDLLDENGGLVQGDCTAPCTASNLSAVSKSGAKADIEAALGIETED